MERSDALFVLCRVENVYSYAYVVDMSYLPHKQRCVYYGNSVGRPRIQHSAA